MIQSGGFLLVNFLYPFEMILKIINKVEGFSKEKRKLMM